MVRAPVLLACLAACGGGAKAPPPAAPHDPVAPTPAPVAAPAPAAPVPTPAWTPESISTIATEEGGHRFEKEPTPTKLWAADADGDLLLIGVAPPTYSFVIPASKKRFSGHIDAPYRSDAFATVTKALDVVVPPLAGVSKGALVDLQLAASPARTVIGVLADVSNANVIVGGGDLPDLDVYTRHLPWDVVLTAVASKVGLDLQREGSTFFLLPPGTKPPVLDKKLPTVRLDLVADGATVAQIVTALRALSPLKVGACTTKRVSLRMKHATVAEVVRAVEVLSGDKLTASVACPSTVIAQEPKAELKPTVYASAGTKRLVVFEHSDSIVTGTVDHKRIEYIGRDRMSFVGDTAPDALPRPAADDTWKRTLLRTSAILEIDGKRAALVLTTSGTRPVSSTIQMPTDPDTISWDVAQWAVHVKRDGQPFHTLPLAPAN